MAKQYLDEQVFERDGFKCVYCDFDGRKFRGWAFLEVDHFKPKRLDNGGNTHDLANLKTCCCICNRMKGGSDWPDVPEARQHLQAMWNRMYGYWKKNVAPRIPPPFTEASGNSK